MGAHVSKQVQRRKAISAQKKALCDLYRSSGNSFPCSDYVSADRKNWMAALDPSRVRINQIVWPGTHDSATNKIGIRFISRPFAQCQSLSVYRQLVLGARVLDIRVQQDRRVCHGILESYHFDVVVADVKRFLSETKSEILILEVRTEYGHEDPPGFDKHLAEELGEWLIHQDDGVFKRTVAEVLPRRVICVWKPRSSAQPGRGGALWGAAYLRDHWADTDLPSTKFDHNLARLREQTAAAARRFFYRVENTATPQADNPVVCVRPVTRRIHGYARLFINRCFAEGCADRLQIFSTDFINEDFVDACVGLTRSRALGMT